MEFEDGWRFGLDDGNDAYDPSSAHAPLYQSLPPTTDTYEPGLPWFHPQNTVTPHGPIVPQTQSYLLPHSSSTPGSMRSSAYNSPFWEKDNNCQTDYQHTDPSSSESSFENLSWAKDRAAASVWLSNLKHDVWTVADRDIQEAKLLLGSSVAHSSSLDSVMGDGISTNDNKYLQLYWKRIHPCYPVVERRTFETCESCPLLRAAVMALGAQASNEASDKKRGSWLHERCVKVLEAVRFS